MTNFFQVGEIANGVINRLRSTIHGNHLGSYEHVPVCATWFSSLSGKRRDPDPRLERIVGGGPTPVDTRSGGRPQQNREKRSKTSDIEDRKGKGILLFDPAVAGSRQPPPCDVVWRAKDMKSAESLCMNFMCQGRYCPLDPCPKPHITNTRVLGKAKEQQLVAWVDKQPGLKFAPGKAPAGTK